MSKSLQDQLLTLGLARKKPAATCRGRSSKKSPERSRHVSGKSNEGREKPGAGRAESKSDTEIDLARAYALRKKEEQQQLEAARRRKREEERRRRQLNKEIGAIVKAHRLNDAKAELSRNFMYKGRIRKIHLTPEQLKSVNQGDLGVVYMSGGYHLLARDHVDAVLELSADHVPDLAGVSEDDGDFPVPDDLVW